MRKRWRRARPRSRVLVVAALALVLAGVGTGTWWLVGRQSATAAMPDATTTTTAASLTTMEKSVSSSGTLTPTVQEDVSFEVSGTVTSVAVAAGDTVTVGQTLATVDTLQLDASLLEAKATLVTAEAKLADLEDDADGSDSSDAQIAAAQAQVAVAEAGVTSATDDLAGATLVAPVAGLVTSVGIEVGDVVGSSGGSGTGASTGAGASTGSTGSTTTSTAAFSIVGTDAYTTQLSVDDSEVANIAVGDQVELTSDDLDGTVFGVVSTIGLLSTSTGVAAYPVTVDITGDVSTLHDGIAVDAQIIYERRTDVLTVPSAAITTTDGVSTVTLVAADGTTSEVTVETGETSGDVTEITSGLAEGDEVQVTTYATQGGDGSSGSTTDRQMQFPGGGTMPEGFDPANGGGQMPQMGGQG